MKSQFSAAVEDFLAPMEELLKPRAQISDIFLISDYEIHSINEVLEGWLPISTNKIMLSLVIQ